MFWKRQKYRLPRFPATVPQTFKMLCGCVTSEELSELKIAVDTRLQNIIERSAECSYADVEGAKKLAELCHYLLDRYIDYSPKLQSLIIGAVRYFAISDDPFDDNVFASGLYDDTRIMNHVLEKLDIHDRYLSLNYS